MRFVAPTRDELLALEAKYVQMESLRQSRERGEPIPGRMVFKSLAERFPGVLRELDTLPMDVIIFRRHALGEAITRGIVAPWIPWMVAYHELMRAALWIKIRTAKQPDVTNERMTFLLRGITNEFGFGVDESFVLDVVRPRAGRLNAVVLGRLEIIFGVPVAEIRKGLFGGRAQSS
jgi:hypothetical protein